jgi:hypothetical protein
MSTYTPLHLNQKREVGRGSLTGEALAMMETGDSDVTPSFKAKLNAHSLCVQESNLHTSIQKMDTE